MIVSEELRIVVTRDKLSLPQLLLCVEVAVVVIVRGSPDLHEQRTFRRVVRAYS